MEAGKLKSKAVWFLAGVLLLHVAVFWRYRQLVFSGYPDFTIFYTVGRMVREGLGPNLYDQQAQYRVKREFAPWAAIRQGAVPYMHPPFEALLFVPFSRLPYFPAYLLWNGINLLVLVAVPRLLRPQVPMLREVSLFWCVAAELAFFPAFITLLQGQDSILLLLLVVLAFVALRNNHDFRAGCWLGLGLFRFQLVLPFLLIFVLQKRRTAVLGFVAVALVLGVSSVAVVGWREATAYPVYLWEVERFVGNTSAVVSVMPNVRGLLNLIGRTRTPAVLDTLIVLVSIPLIALAAMKWKASAKGIAWDLGFSLSAVIAVLVGYHVLVHDLSVLLLPLCLLLNHLRASGMAQGWRGVAIVGPMLVLFCSPLQLVLWFRLNCFSLMALVLLLWVWGITEEMSSQGSLPGMNPTTTPEST